MYQVERPSQSDFVAVRGLRYHVRRWGQPQPGQRPWVMVHGWMDVAASFQFVVDALPSLPFVIAPDWRGFGHTASGGADCFWFQDYLADLDALLAHYVPDDAPVNLIGHSMGGNIAMLYAGVRPQRVARLVNLEGFGLPATVPAQAPGRLTQWLDEVRACRSGALQLKTYPSLEAVAQRLMKTNRHLNADKARWLAQHWAQEIAPGCWQILGEAGHKVVNPQLYRVEEIQAVHACITAPVLMVEAEDESMTQWWRGNFTLAEHRERLRVLSQVRIERVDGCGHMLHHDQPEAVAALIQAFLSAS
ncbi:MAG: alpha/beta hydrolase [Rhodoferax sp.]